MLPDLRQNCNAKHSAIIRKADITPLDFQNLLCWIRIGTGTRST